MRLFAMDTETVHRKPWCVQFSQKQGTGYMVMATDHSALSAIRTHVQRDDVLTIFHNALFDLRILHELDIHPAHWTDTMVMAYLLQSESKGLKALAYRHCNIKMQEYEEVVRPASERFAFDYLSSVLQHTWPDPIPTAYYDPQGVLKVKKGQNIEKKVLRALQDYGKGEKVVDLRKRWVEMEGTEQVEEVLGPMPEGTLADIPFDTARKYSCKDPDATLGVYHALYPRIVEEGLLPSLERDIACQTMVLDMMGYGVLIDPEHFRALSEDYTVKMAELQKEINAVAGRNINLNSPLQVGEFLYEKGVIGKTNKLVQSTGEWEEGYESTAADVLDKLKPNFPIVRTIQRYRSLSKFKSTYVDALPACMGDDQRVRSDMSMTRTDTGRLASSHPNIQNQPTRNEEGKVIRKGFVAQPGCVYLSIDLGQIEMRCAAHESGDAAMIRTFNDPKGDVHTETAIAMFPHVAVIDKEKHRYPAKRTGFGVLYDITAMGLYDVFVHEDIYTFSEDDCQGFIDGWYRAHPGIRDWKDEIKGFARRHGWVEDMFGRKRWVPEAQSVIEKVRDAGLRKAVNAPIQMGAQGIIKEIMTILTPLYKDMNRHFICRPLLQIHDELIFEVEEERVEGVVDVFVPVFEHAVTLRVPVQCDAEVGYNWMDTVDYYKKWRKVG